jgi:two-component system LytT family sensor kinase
MRMTIPLLSIQPLVENAVKHGVASRMGAGFVHLKIKVDGETVSVEVSNSGVWDRSPRLLSQCDPPSPGIGLTNVRRRLELCYGPTARFDIRAENGVTTVAFVLPTKPAPPGLPFNEVVALS